MNNSQWAYFLLRLTLGINLFTHGLARFLDWHKFVDHLAEQFHKTILPDILATWMGWALPPLEFILGILLILGLFTSTALKIGALLLAALVFGACLLQNWEIVGLQMIYALIYYFLLSHLENNRLSIDHHVPK